VNRSIDELKVRLLELGMEGETSVPEAVSYEADATHDSRETVVASVRRALIELIRDEEIVVFMGETTRNTSMLDPEIAIRLLEESKWFEFGAANNETRIEFISSGNWNGPRPILK
jgi:hypothetical protein